MTFSPLTSHPTDIWPVPPVRKEGKGKKARAEKNRLITMKRQLTEKGGLPQKQMVSNIKQADLWGIGVK